jgi:4-hydroxythreonine-4-phosphate dehydrogenase
MIQRPKFIFMLTHNDVTVPDALDHVGAAARIEAVSIMGFKDVGLSLEDLRRVAEAIRTIDCSVALEVVSLDERAELRSVEAAIELKVDMLLGGTRAERVSELLLDTGIPYYPFPGRVVGHPSQLTGTQQEIVDSARQIAALPGVHGLDLLAYRWQEGDPAVLARAVVSAVDVPVIAAGGIDRPERVRSLAEAGVRAFTVGSAVFESQFFPDRPGVGHQLRAIVNVLEGS